MKQFLKIASLLPLLVYTLSLHAQINKFRQGSSEGEEESENTNQETSKEKSALSPDTARTLVYTFNLYASYTQKPYTAGLHAFHQYSVLEKNKQTYASLGNVGSAVTPITFTDNSTMGMTFRKDAFNVYQYQIENIKFYELEKPFSELHYVMGKAKEQQLLFSHSQQVKKGLTLGLHARYQNSPGLYLRQRAYYATGYFTVRYVLPDKRYGVMAAYLNDRQQNYENGGITYDSVFQENTESNRKTINVNLNNASNRSKNAGILLQHYFTLQRQGPSKTDSIESQTKKFNAGRIVHTFKYKRLTTAFQDDKTYTSILSRFYPTVYGDSVSTLDSNFHTQLENHFVYSNIEPDTSGSSFPFQYAFGISHRIDKIGFTTEYQVNQMVPVYVFSAKELVTNSLIQKQYTQITPFGTLKGIIARKTYFIADGHLSIGGYNSGDYELKGQFYQYFGKKESLKRISLTASKGLRHADYFFSHYFSNHFRWDRDLKSQDYLSATAKLEFFGYELGVSYFRTSNYTWLNEDIQPEQSQDAISIYRADAAKIFRLSHWIFDAHVTLQQTSRDSIVSLPSVVADASISYSRLLFKKVLLAEIGLQGLYYSAYHADKYMPAVRMFYKQNTEVFGDYPYIDAFINLKVKRARIFLKYQHMNAGWFGYSYIMTPHYPGADAAFKAGVTWVFYD
ncbi:MAG: hypothetical protein IPH84_09315 [Bacteroidales bacterium]|nr:hypothetical protein [Bacteroidales bacterium]